MPRHRYHIPYTKPTRAIIRWIWGELRDNRRQALLNMVLGVTMVLLDLVFVWGTKLAIDTATGQAHGASLAVVSALLVAIILCQIAIGFASKWIHALLGVKALNGMQRKVFGHMMQSEWNGLDRYHTGDVLNRIEKDATQVINFVTESLPSLVTVVVQFCGAFIFLFLMDHMLALAIVILLPTFILISKMYIRKMRSLSREVRQSDSRIQSLVQESIQHRTVIKTLQRTESLLSRLYLVQETMRNQVKSRTKYSAVSSTIMNIGFATGYLFTFIWGTYRLEAGAITYGALMAFIQLVGQIQGPARSLTSYIPVFINTFTSAERVMELEEIPRETVDQTPELTAPLGLRLSDVSYSYRPTDGGDSAPTTVVSHLSYDFQPGTVTAVMGPTGVGKTTLIRLMLALVHPEAGHVNLYDATRSVEVSPATRAYFAYVPQGNTLLSGTIRDNLLLGDPKATEEQMKQALQMAAADFVTELPQGLDTLCGEQGYGLSEGQAQRICIARTLLRPCPILLLDEATSALDITTEQQVLQRIAAQSDGKTVIVISHREAILDYTTHILRLG